VFRSYADNLVDKLVSDYDIRGKTIVEIGSGRGEFLRRLCAAGSNRGIGFDTSTPIEGQDPEDPNVRYIRDYFSSSYSDVRADLIVCQQVLEHVENPKEFLTALNSTSTFRTESPIIYFEVPNGLYTAKQLGIWDLIYEHISYFTPTSLRRIFEDTGFTILEMGPAFGDQYLYVTAQALRRGDASAVEASPIELETAASFSKAFTDKLGHFRAWMDGHDAQLAQTFVWGAGSKGITFCNLIDPDGRLVGLIDKNGAKHGKYIAGTGLRVARFESIDAGRIANVVVMNPQYVQEIGRDLTRAGAAASLVLA
jgi:Methyltransferase domain/C-methyltransferase C-terminal domain